MCLSACQARLTGERPWFSEIGSGAPLRHIQNRATSLQSWFRRTSTWGFFQADSNMKRQLFFKNRARVKSGLGKEAGNNFERAFGTVMPSSIPESMAWWRRQSKVRCWVPEERQAQKPSYLSPFGRLK